MTHPTLKRAVRVLMAVLVATSLIGCTGQPAPRKTVTSVGPSRPATSPADTSCTPTLPNGATPPGEQPSDSFYGNGKLFTTLWKGGVVVFEAGGAGEMRPDGSLAMKWPFWRGKGVSGRIEIGGRSLHRVGLRVLGDVPQGYGSTGFQAAGLIFPEPGCYEVTATAGGATLSFVTIVEKR